MDIIDVFAVLISINVSPVFGGLFGMVNLVFPKLFGPREYILYTIKDGIGFFFCGLLTPVWYSISGGNLLLTMYIFTVMRYLFYVILTLLIDPEEIGYEIFVCITGFPIAYATNTVHIALFGQALDDLFKQGVQVTWGIFFFVTLVIVGYILFSKWLVKYELKKKQKLEELKKNPQKYLEAKQNLVEGFHDDEIPSFPEIYEIFLDLFDNHNIPGIIKGTVREFKVKSLLVMLLCFGTRFYFASYMPSIVEMIITVVMVYSAIDFLLRFFGWINRSIQKSFARPITIVLGSFFMFVIVIGPLI